jgi:hypothetical protein
LSYSSATQPLARGCADSSEDGEEVDVEDEHGAELGDESVVDEGADVGLGFVFVAAGVG